jgi:hypothetical protein
VLVKIYMVEVGVAEAGRMCGVLSRSSGKALTVTFAVLQPVLFSCRSLKPIHSSLGVYSIVGKAGPLSDPNEKLIG